MPERFLVLGAGERGLAAARELLLADRATRLLLADRAREALAHGVGTLLGRDPSAVGRIRSEALEAADRAAVAKLAREAEVVIGALPSGLAAGVARAAIAARRPLLDLGSEAADLLALLTLDGEARRAGVALVGGGGESGADPGAVDDRWPGFFAASLARALAHHEIAEGAWRADRVLARRPIEIAARAAGVRAPDDPNEPEDDR